MSRGIWRYPLARLAILAVLVLGIAVIAGGRWSAPSPDAQAAQLPGQITVSAGGPYTGRVGQPITFIASVRSPLPPGTAFQFRWNFGDGSSGFGQTAGHIYSAPGTYSVTVTVIGGGQTAFGTTTASITQPVQPFIVSAGGPYTGQVGQVIQFQGSVPGPFIGVALRYQWSFGDGTFGAGASPTKVYQAPGVYTVTLQVTASNGQQGFATTTASITQPIQQLTVSAGGPYSGVAGSSVTFFGNSTGAQNPRYQWNFGDNGAGVGQVVTHTFSNPGSWLVTLTVTDLSTGRSATATTSANVIAPPEPPAPDAPIGRSFAGFSYFPPNQTSVLFGGMVCTGSRCSDQEDTWTLSGSDWTDQSPASNPSTRYGMAMAHHAPSGRVVLFGGLDCQGESCDDSNETWTWDGSNWQLMNPSARPSERSNAAMVFDPVRGVIVLFGGQDTGGAILDDTWTWNGSTWTPMNPATKPSARFGAGAAFDVARGAMVLFGGRDNGPSDLGDTWTWDGTNWTQASPATSATSRAFAAMEYDAARNLTVLFGGVANGNNALGDTWTWNGTTWTQQNPGASPTPRYGAAITFDAAQGVIALFSGTNGADDLWFWNGSSWSQQ